MNPERHNLRTIAQQTWNNERLLKVLSVAIVVGLVTSAILLSDHLPNYKSAGYAGVFVLSLVSSASILVPVPGIAAVCAGPGLLNLVPLVVALLASVAESIGELTGYMIGFSSRGLGENNRIYPRVEVWMERRGSIALFLASSIPNPLFDLVGIAAGKLRYPIFRFLMAIWAGKMVKSTVVAYSCFYGFEDALSFFGLH